MEAISTVAFFRPVWSQELDITDFDISVYMFETARIE